MRASIQELSSGQLQKLSLRTINGQEISLDKSSLLTLDRLYFAYLLDGAPAGAATIIPASLATPKPGQKVAADTGVDDDVVETVDNSRMFTSSGTGGSKDDVAGYAQGLA